MLNFGPTQYGVGGKGGGDINSKKNEDGQHKWQSFEQSYNAHRHIAIAM